MGAAQAKLSEQPEIIDLLRVLEQSKLMKERQEVESLVNYLDSMESQFGEVLKELKEVKGQLTQIQDKGVKSSATRLMEGAENKIGEIGSQLQTVRENIVKSARAAVQAFKEKGVGALQKAVEAMKIPSALSRLKEAFRSGKESMNDRADKMAVISSELHVIGSHTKNVGRILMGKAAKEVEPQNMDKGITARIEKAYLACGRGFERMEQGTDWAMKKLEKFMEWGKKPSVNGNEADWAAGLVEVQVYGKDQNNSEDDQNGGQSKPEDDQNGGQNKPEDDQNGSQNKSDKNQVGKPSTLDKQQNHATELSSKQPKTGDSTSIALYVILICVAAAGIIGAIYMRKKN